MKAIIFSIAHTPEVILKARRLCHDTYLNMGYISKAYPGHVLPEHDMASTYIVATNSRLEVVGTITLSGRIPGNIFDAWNGKLFVAGNTLVHNALSLHSFSISSLAVNKAYSTMKISHGLYQMAYQWALANNMAYGIICMDHRAFRALKMAGWHAVQVGEPVYYLGSPTVPAIIPIREQQDSMLEKQALYFKHAA